MPAKINFLPGEIIRSAEQNTNFSLLFNKPILIPYSIQIGAQAGIMSYSLSPAELAAILTLAPLGAVPTMTSLVTVGDTVDLEDGSDAIIDQASQELIRGTVQAGVSNSSVVINFNHAVTGSAVVLILPVHTVFHALPEDFLRREFVSSLESDDPIRKLQRGAITLVQEAALVAGFLAADAGTQWFNTVDGQFKGWNGNTGSGNYDGVVILG